MTPCFHDPSVYATAEDQGMCRRARATSAQPESPHECTRYNESSPSLGRWPGRNPPLRPSQAEKGGWAPPGWAPNPSRTLPPSTDRAPGHDPICRRPHHRLTVQGRQHVPAVPTAHTAGTDGASRPARIQPPVYICGNCNHGAVDKVQDRVDLELSRFARAEGPVAGGATGGRTR
jgi:hypothetical protein